MTEFKVHSQEEVTVPPTVSYNLSSSSPLNVDGKSSGYVISSSQNGSIPRQEEYKLEYWGKYEVPAPSSGSTDQVVLIDTLVAKYRDVTGTILGKFRTKKKSFGSRFMHRNSSKVSAGDDVGALDAGDSSHSLEALRDVDGEANAEGEEIPITFTASPTGEEEDGEGEGEGSSHQGASTSPEDPAEQHTSYSQTTSSADQAQLCPGDQPPADLVDHHSSMTVPTEPNGRGRTESTGFDTLPELANLKGSSEFQALSLKKSSTRGQSVQHVRLLFSGVTVLVHPQQSQHVILKKTIQNIACCAQVC